MKSFKLFIVIGYCMVSASVFAQSAASIESELLKAFKKIDYRKDDNTDADNKFAKMLKDYTEKYPATIKQDFGLLSAAHLDISNSFDGLFRIYSWDTWSGGTMHFFESVFQYQSGSGVKSVLDTSKGEGDSRPNYIKLYTFKANNKTYYLAVYRVIGSTKDVGQGIQVFAIEDGKLNEDVKIIKTSSGLHSEINIDYDFFSIVDWKVRPVIHFDETSKMIFIPLVGANGKVSHSFITYKFTGICFEKVKS